MKIRRLGFLSSSREGKLPETRINPASLDVDSDAPAVEKKVNMKKLIEGIKKTDEPIKKKDVKEAENVEKDTEKCKEKEKEKPRKKKTKILEEFAFFDKEKLSANSKSPVPESKTPSDPNKQKLNIFRKIAKTKDVDASASSAVFRSPAEQGEPTSGEEVHNEAMGLVSEIGVPPRSSEVSPLSGSKTKISKKERKIKPSKNSVFDSGAKEDRSSVKDSRSVHKKEKPSSSRARIDDYVEPDELHGIFKERIAEEKSSVSNVDSLDLPKKKSSRPSKASSSRELPQDIPTRSPETPSSSSGMPVSPIKPFFPFPSHFPVPGLIPPPLFQNVPFNLLGMPIGLRPPFAMPPSSMGHMPPSLQPPTPNANQSFFTPPRNDGPPKLQSSPKKTSPNIVDSLPEASEMSFAGPSSVSVVSDEPPIKKEKRDKKEKEKKKKDKKMKDKDKGEGSEKKLKREKKKDKKDKSKDKEEGASTVPKITFKFGAAPSPRSQTPESTPKM